MAQIKKTDIIENGVFSNTIEDSKELLKLMNALDKEFMKVSASAKEIKKNIDFSKVSDINKFITLEKQLSTQFDQTTNLMKQRKTVQDQLRASTDEEVKGKLRLQKVNKEQRDALKNEIVLNDKLAGTEEKLIALNKKLRAERRKLNTDTKEGQRRLREINAAIDRNNAALERNADQMKKQRLGIGRYGEALRKNIRRFVGWTAVVSLATRAIRGATKDIIGFEKAQADLAGVLGKTRREVKVLTQDAKRLGATTIFKPKEVSALQKEFAKLGFSIGQIQNMTKATLDFATATNTDLARAAEVVGGTLNAFQLGAEETTRVVNVMNESFTRSALDTERFSLAMGKVGAVATQAGLSLEQTTATLGILVSNGIKAENAGTALRNILLKVSETGEDLDTVLKEINGSTDRVAAATKRFGTQNTAVALTMATMQKESAELTEQLEAQGRTAESVAEEQMDTLSGSLKQLSSAWDGLILSLEEGDGVFSRLGRRLVNFATKVLETIRLANMSNEEVIAEALDKGAKKAQESASETIKQTIELSKKSFKELADLDVQRFGQVQESTFKIRDLRKQGLKEVEIAAMLINKNIFKSEQEIEEDRIRLAKRTQDLKKNLAGAGNEAILELDKQYGKDFNDLTKAQQEQYLKAQEERTKEIQRQYKGEIALLNKSIAEQSALMMQRDEFILREIKASTNDELTILKQSNDKKIALEAEYEEARRLINQEGTEEDKKENKKRLDNHKRYLDEKYRLEVRFRELIRKLDRDFDKIDNERNNQLNQLRLEALERQIEEEKQLQLQRAESGQQVDLTALNELFEEKQRLIDETARLQQDLDRKLNHQNFNDQKADIEELYRLRIENLEKLNAKKAEFDKADLERKAALERATRNFETSQDIIDTQGDEDRRKGREEIKKEQEEFNSEIEENQRKHNEEMKEISDEAAEQEREAQEKRIQARKETFETLNALGRAFAEKEQERLAKEIENIDKAIDASKRRVDSLKDSSNTNKQTIESNIAFEEAKQAQLEKQRLDAEKKQRQIELATTAVEVYSNKVANNDPNPLLNTIKDITLLQQFVKNIPLFWEGTDTTVGAALGTPHLNTARDGYIVRVDKDEKILNPYLSAMTGNMTTEEIAQAAYDKRMGIAQYTNPFDLSNQSISVANVVNNNSMYLLQQEMFKYRQEQQETNDKLQELINKPTSSIFYNDEGAIPKIVQKTIEGNKITTRNKFLR